MVVLTQPKKVLHKWAILDRNVCFVCIVWAV